jgi:hypothetical protein
MKGITFFGRPRFFEKLDRRHCTEYHLTPLEVWLLIKLHGHQDGIFTPSLREIAAAAKAEGEDGMPDIKTLEKAYQGLQNKGYVQTRKVNPGSVWVRSVTMEPGVFAPGRDLLGPSAPTDEELTKEIVKFNAEQRRPDIVRQAYDRCARRERAAAGNVVSLDEHRRSRTG